MENEKKGKMNVMRSKEIEITHDIVGTLSFTIWLVVELILDGSCILL